MQIKFSKKYITLFFLTFLCSGVSTNALADRSRISNPVCNTEGTGSASVTFTVYNTHENQSSYNLYVGPHKAVIGVPGNQRTSYTLNNISDGIHRAGVRRNGKRIGRSRILKVDCALPPPLNSATIAKQSFCPDSGINKGALAFTLTNTGSNSNEFRVTVGPHGATNLVVGAKQTSEFILNGIPDGTHAANVYDVSNGDTVLATSSVSVACYEPPVNSATIAEQSFCPDSGINKGALAFTLTNTGFNSNEFRVTVGPHGATNLVVGAKQTSEFILNGIPDGTHTANVYDVSNGDTNLATSTVSVDCEVPVESGPLVRSFVVIPSDRLTEQGTDTVVADFNQMMAEDVRVWYDSVVGSTYEYIGSTTIESDKPNEWFWCRTVDVDPVELGCAADNYEQNLVSVITQSADVNLELGSGYYNMILGVGGSGYAGARVTRGIVGEGSLYAYRFGCATLPLPFPGDNVRDTCAAGNWATYGVAAGTIAHELGHTFDLPHPPEEDMVRCEQSIMAYHGCFPNASLLPGEIEKLQTLFTGNESQ